MLSTPGRQDTDGRQLYTYAGICEPAVYLGQAIFGVRTIQYSGIQEGFAPRNRTANDQNL